MNPDGLINPTEITGHNDTSGISFVACQAYARHGEYYRGNLLVVQYQHCIGRASASNFGRNSYSDWAEYAERKAKELFGQFDKMRLAIPDVVLEYPKGVDLQGLVGKAQ